MRAVILLINVVCAAGSSFAMGPRLQPRHRRLAMPSVVLCDTEAVLGGRPLQEGDALIHKDKESDAWWRAEAREVIAGRVLLHYAGCDAEWDTWVDINPETLYRMDPREPSAAFQSEEYEASLADDDLLAQMRQKKLDDNARWQLDTFAKAQMGEFGGSLVEYVPKVLSDGNLGFAKSEAVECSWKMARTEAGPEDPDGVELLEMLAGAEATLDGLAMNTQFDYPAFLGAVGNQAVGDGYTLTKLADRGDDRDSMLIEVGLREDARRVRCKLLYATGGSDGSRVLQKVGVATESLSGSPKFTDGSADNENDLDGRPGRGLYDTPPRSDGSYMTLYCEGGVTLVFPTEIPADSAGAISLDWVAGKMRYQIDRKFARLDGSISSLELTEIRKSDAEVYPPKPMR